jgi:hypothetical protein
MIEGLVPTYLLAFFAWKAAFLRNLTAFLACKRLVTRLPGIDSSFPLVRVETSALCSIAARSAHNNQPSFDQESPLRTETY